MNNVFKKKIKSISYKNEKFRFLLFVFSLFFILFLARYLLGLAYSRYEIRAKINSNVEKALYIFEGEQLSFNLEPQGIIPSNSSYVYRFSVSNFNQTKQSDVDLSYTIKVRTTTNLPITVQLYRNELYNSPGATNLFSGSVIQQDEDLTWYRLYDSNATYQMSYQNQVTDIYTIVIDFPASYASDIVYANSIESIEVILNSQQII